MAVIKLGGGVADMRGSIGGTVFSRGPAGAYARQRVKPINPATHLQAAVRARVSYLATAWSKTLIDTERTGWKAFAANTNFTNKVGDTILISGIACYIRLNSLRLQMGLAVQNTAPLAFGYAAGTIAPINSSMNPASITVYEPSAGFDKTSPLEAIAVFQALPMHAGRTQSPRGWRYLGKIVGAASPPSFPVIFTPLYPASLHDMQAVSLTHLDLDGRVASPVDSLVHVDA